MQGLVEPADMRYNKIDVHVWERSDLNVSMDPRLMKQLLSYQWIDPAGIIGGRNPALQQNNGIFGMLLEQLLTVETVNTSAIGTFAGGLGLSGISLMARTPGPALADPLQTGSSGASQSYDKFIAAAAAKYGVHEALIKGVIQTESGFDADAVSPAGAKGLMQLMDDTARWLGVQNPWDPAQNIDAGTRYLSYLLRKYDGNVYPALAAYNAGPGRVDRLGLTSDELVRARYAELPEETRGYIPKVLQAALQWGLKL